jgi:hypothetical protein
MSRISLNFLANNAPYLQKRAIFMGQSVGLEGKCIFVRPCAVKSEVLSWSGFHGPPSSDFLLLQAMLPVA